MRIDEEEIDKRVQRVDKEEEEEDKGFKDRISKEEVK